MLFTSVFVMWNWSLWRNILWHELGTGAEGPRTAQTMRREKRLQSFRGLLSFAGSDNHERPDHRHDRSTQQPHDTPWNTDVLQAARPILSEVEGGRRVLDGGW